MCPTRRKLGDGDRIMSDAAQQNGFSTHKLQDLTSAFFLFFIFRTRALQFLRTRALQFLRTRALQFLRIRA